MPLRLVASEHRQLSKLMVVLYTFRYHGQAEDVQ
jgi:hypothetical protein